jgi:hypothetical protein
MRWLHLMTLVQALPFAVSPAAGLVAMFAAFAGMSDLMAAAGSVCGTAALLWFVINAM